MTSTATVKIKTIMYFIVIHDATFILKFNITHQTLKLIIDIRKLNTLLLFNQDEYPNFIYTGIVNKVNTLISNILEYLTR